MRLTIRPSPSQAPEQPTKPAPAPAGGELRRLASDPATPPDVLARPAQDGTFWLRRDAARHPPTPRPMLDLLRRAGSTPCLSSTARPDPTLDPTTLARLAAGGEWARRLAAAHPNTSA